MAIVQTGSEVEWTKSRSPNSGHFLLSSGAAVWGQINSVRCVQRPAYQPQGNGISGQLAPLSFAALWGPPLIWGWQAGQEGVAQPRGRMGTRPVKPSIGFPRSSRLKVDPVASVRPSVGRRIIRTVTPFFIVVLIGVGGTLQLFQSSAATTCVVSS